MGSPGEGVTEECESSQIIERGHQGWGGTQAVGDRGRGKGTRRTGGVPTEEWGVQWRWEGPQCVVVGGARGGSLPLGRPQETQSR